MKSNTNTIGEAFKSPHLDYGDTIFDQSFIDSFYRKIESVTCDIAIPITGTIRRTYKEKALFLTATCLPRVRFWATVKGTTSQTRC